MTEYALWIVSGLSLILMICTVALYRQHRLFRHERHTRIKLESKLRHLAALDPLTHLPNRAALLEQMRVLLKLAHRHHKTPALLYMNINDFKTIHEQLGPEQASQLLVEVADRLRGIVRESDLLGRLGNDEFLLVADHCTEDGSSNLAIKVMAQFNRPFMLEQQAVSISASLGIARYTDCGENADELISRACDSMKQIRDSLGLTSKHSIHQNTY
ncbi:MAG: GGDEF domain-containing protein [Marinobacterium sp.]|nr:GGDEF domain-containing protein [Marinobacterium sp.]